MRDLVRMKEYQFEEHVQVVSPFYEGPLRLYRDPRLPNLIVGSYRLRGGHLYHRGRLPVQRTVWQWHAEWIDE